MSRTLFTGVRILDRDGVLADLLLVKGDPLSDLKLLLDIDNLLAVVKNGEFHKRPA